MTSPSRVGDTKRTSGVYALNVVIASGMGMIGVLWLSHLVHPRVFGFYTVAVGWAAIAGVLMYGWNTSALTRLLPGANRPTSNALRTAAWRAGIAVLLVGFGIGLVVVRWFPHFGYGLILAACALPINLRIAEARALSQVASYTRHNIALAIAGSATPIASVAIFHDPPASLIVTCTATSLTIGSLISIPRGRLTDGNDSYGFARKVHLQFGLPLVPSAAGLITLSSGDRVIVAWLLGEAAAGSYAVNYALFVRPFVLIAAAVQLICVAQLSHEANVTSTQAAMKLWRRWMRRVFVIGAIVFFFLVSARSILLTLVPSELRIENGAFELLASLAGIGYLIYVLAVQPANLLRRSRQIATNILSWAVAANLSVIGLLVAGKGLVAVVSVSAIAYWGASFAIGVYGVRQIAAADHEEPSSHRLRAKGTPR